jgi:hypothetical protein
MILNDALEIDFATSFNLVWNDKGTGADRNGSFYRPVVPIGFRALGHYAQGNYDSPTGAVMIVVKARNADALKEPKDYELVWKDTGSGADKDGAIWKPIPPDGGYVAMGFVVTQGYNKPSLNEVVCVREQLTEKALPGGLIWNDKGSGADKDFSCWNMKAPTSPSEGEGYVATGTFWGVDSYTQPIGDSCLHVLKLRLQVENPTNNLPVPILHSYQEPSIYENDSFTSVLNLPFFAVKDTFLSDAQKAKDSPVYKLLRQDRYKLVFHSYNHTSIEQNPSISFTEGFEESESTSFTSTTGIEIGVEYGFTAALTGSIKISQSFSYSTTSVSTNSKSVTVTVPLKVPPQTAVGAWVVESRYTLYRQDGSQVGTSIDCGFSKTIKFAQYPPEPSQPSIPAQVKDRLSAGESLQPGEKLISSKGIFRLEYQTDGNLVISKNSTPIWASNTKCQPAGVFRFQDDGNLVIYDIKNTVLWASNTGGPQYLGSKLIMQDDGNLVAYNPQSAPYWSSGTSQ